jgi:hypothetical protein
VHDFHFGYELHRERLARAEKEAAIRLLLPERERRRPTISFSVPRLHRRTRLVPRAVR